MSIPLDMIVKDFTCNLVILLRFVSDLLRFINFSGISVLLREVLGVDYEIDIFKNEKVKWLNYIRKFVVLRAEYV